MPRVRRVCACVVALAALIVACSSSGSSNSGGSVSCDQLCQHVSSTVCTSGATVQTTSDCLARCHQWADPTPTSCKAQLDAFNSCCAYKDLSFKCPTDSNISAGDCNDSDTCGTQADALEACCTNAGTACKT